MFSCTHPHQTGPQRAFYYWKQQCHLTSDDLSTFKQLHIAKLYVRYFDLVREEGKLTITPIVSLGTNLKQSGLEIIPVVFITPEVFKGLDEKKTPDTIKQLLKTIVKIEQDAGLNPFKEFQIDCDWTPSIKARFFFFLQTLKDHPEMKGRKLTCTIRLHQLADPFKTGTPPVDCGMLMPYNLNPVHRFGTTDSIMDAKTLRSYIERSKSYPLSLDLVLPIFSWAAHFDMDKNFLGLIRDVTLGDLKKNTKLRQNEKRLYQASEETFLNDTKILKGDYLRLDGASYDQLVSTARYLNKKKKLFTLTDNITISLFHYSPETINNITDGQPELLGKVFETFK